MFNEDYKIWRHFYKKTRGPFYKVFFRLMLVVALQNLVAYSVNMLDNMMLEAMIRMHFPGQLL